MILSFSEILDMVLMSAIVGFIFMDTFSRFKPTEGYDPLLQSPKSHFDWNALKFAALVTAPAIILHELGHKFLALYFGMNATFHAAYTWLGLGVLLKLLSFPFIFFVPAFVSISGGTPLEHSLTAFAGPLVNLVLWLSTALLLKSKSIKRKYIPAIALTSKVNMFLFIFNILPIPGFDGFQFFKGLYSYFF